MSYCVVYTCLSIFGILLPVTWSNNCPENKDDLRRIGSTRYFIIHNTKRGSFVNFTAAKEQCAAYGLKTATIKNLTTMAVVSAYLENLVYELHLKDTWYWLDAQYNGAENQYFWANNKEPLSFNLYLYREPRPTGVGAHITYFKEYQPDRNLSQCITLALPWPGAGDPRTKKYVYGHQTTMDEKHCESESARHAICESTDAGCNSPEGSPFELTEDKGYYFNDGNWIFGDRKYIVNFEQRTFENSTKYCESLGLQVMSPGTQEKHLIPHIKMWTRALKATQYWTTLKYNMTAKAFIDKHGKVVSKSKLNVNFTEDFVQGRSSKADEVYCVALSLVYELTDQMPCNETLGQICSWSFIRYVPANCNNHHGSICQHSDYNRRNISWTYKNFKENLTHILNENALTKDFGFRGNDFVLRSNYKQTFGVLWCPPGYRMLRGGGTNDTQKWSKVLRFINPNSTYQYDYLETYWVVDTDLFNKSIDSESTISYYDTKEETRKFRKASCTNYHFYLCERVKVGVNFQRMLDVVYQPAESVKWKKGPQPRNYPIVYKPDPCTPHYNNYCNCRVSRLCEYNTVTFQCVGKVKNCSDHLFEPGMCRRGGPHVLYSIAGVQCYNHVSTGNCQIEKTIAAVNMVADGKNHVDNFNVTYIAQKNWPKNDWGDPEKLWISHKIEHQIEYCPEGERPLYAGMMSGHHEHMPSGKPHSRGCIYYLIPFDGDGKYEVSVKLIEHKPRKASYYHRHFDIKLNRQHVVRCFDMYHYYSTGYGFHLNFLFEISDNGSVFKLHGHPGTKVILVYGKLNLSFCLGECKSKWTTRDRYGDPNFAVCAFSVLKFSN